MLPYAEPLGAYSAASRAKVKADKKKEASALDHSEETPVEETEALRAVREEDDVNSGGGQKRKRRQGISYYQDILSEEEQALLEKFARIRGLMDFTAAGDKAYQLKINTQNGLVDIVDADSGELAMSLTPDEFHQLSQKMIRYSGTLTDQSA